MGSETNAGTTDDVHEQPMKGWKGIAAVIGVSESWAQRTGREHGRRWS